MTDDPQGKRALYSAPHRRPGTVVVTCSSCDRSTRVTLAELARAHVPVWAWIPWRRPGHALRCPACERRTWVRVDWFA